MLYDPKWEVKADPFSLADFIAWLETQPADERYDWHDVHGCACARYAEVRTGIASTWPSERNALEHIAWPGGRYCDLLARAQAARVAIG